MGKLKWVLAPWAVLLLLQLASASHHTRRSLETEAAAPPASVPASIVSPLLRTGYHFQPPKNWINDPNGPLYYKGWYHLFYQYNPKGAVWGNIIWAHSVSRDLINWIALEPAIKPSIPTDKYGVWSGSATILPDGTPAILYTGIDRPDTNYQIQNIALPKNASDPLLREWVKPAYNPIARPVDGMNATQFRDPTTAWYADGHWRMLVGGLRPDTLRGEAILYRSTDFKTWVRAKHPLHSALTGMWECPDFFPVGGAGQQNGLDTSELGPSVAKHVLKNSLDLTRYDYYTIGTYVLSNKDKNQTEKYVPDNPTGDVYKRLQYDYGNFYASKTFFDPVQKRRILLGWANESDSVAHDKAKGWAGIHAIPRKIWLDPSGKQLLQWPIKEVEKLRAKPVNVGEKVVKPGQHFEVTGLQSYQVRTYRIASPAN